MGDDHMDNMLNDTLLQDTGQDEARRNTARGDGRVYEALSAGNGASSRLFPPLAEPEHAVSTLPPWCGKALGAAITLAAAIAVVFVLVDIPSLVAKGTAKPSTPDVPPGPPPAPHHQLSLTMQRKILPPALVASLGARCMDGTPSGYYFLPGNEANASKYVICKYTTSHLQPATFGDNPR